MSIPKPKTPEQQRAEAEAALKRAADTVAMLKRDDETLARLTPHILKALEAVETIAREAKLPLEDLLVVVSAIENNVKRHIVQKAMPAEVESTEEKTKLEGALHEGVHNLIALGKRVEKRLIEKLKVVAVGKMRLKDDGSIGR